MSLRPRRVDGDVGKGIRAGRSRPRRGHSRACSGDTEVAAVGGTRRTKAARRSRDREMPGEGFAVGFPGDGVALRVLRRGTASFRPHFGKTDLCRAGRGLKRSEAGGRAGVRGPGEPRGKRSHPDQGQCRRQGVIRDILGDSWLDVETDGGGGGWLYFVYFVHININAHIFKVKAARSGPLFRTGLPPAKAAGTGPRSPRPSR